MAIALVFVAALVAGIVGWRFWSKPRPFASISVNQITNIGTIERIALSADGRFLAEVKNDNGQRTLWLRNTATKTDTQILSAFATDYLGLTFSPDGNYLYFTRGTPQNSTRRDLYVMSVFGGTPRQLIMNIDSPVSIAPEGDRLVYVRWTPERRTNFPRSTSPTKRAETNECSIRQRSRSSRRYGLRTGAGSPGSKRNKGRRGSRSA